jgi:hypothetical protein
MEIAPTRLRNLLPKPLNIQRLMTARIARPENRAGLVVEKTTGMEETIDEGETHRDPQDARRCVSNPSPLKNMMAKLTLGPTTASSWKARLTFGMAK